MTVLSAGMVEKMVKWMPDPGPELAPLTDEARSGTGLTLKLTAFDFFGGEGQ